MTRLSSTLLSITIAAAGFGLVGCGGGNEVTRTESNVQIDLSGNWNATDSQMVANAMIADVMTRPWHSDFSGSEGRKPVVKVGRVVVHSNGDIIDTDIFTNDIVREFINSGRVKAVRATGDEWQTRGELKDQDKYSSAETRKESFQETGADYLLTGSIKVQDDKAGRKTQKFYSVDLQLEDIQKGELVWLGNKKISKLVERSR
jgi:uncharacterized protein (TIGR02722 family)